MRYHYQKPDIYLSMYGELYICNHPVYDRSSIESNETYDGEDK